MPLIQVVQDSPETIKAARKQIANMAADIQRTPGKLSLHSYLEFHTTMYLLVLKLHDLLGHDTYMQLKNEFRQARDAAPAEEHAVSELASYE